MRNVFLCAVFALVACSGGTTESRSAASAASSGGGGAGGAGGAGGGCEPCSALHLCNVSCHPAGTPLGYCEACNGAGGAK